MTALRSTPPFDHHLVARAQARATGATAHELHSLIASYYGFRELALAVPDCAARVEDIEHRLRLFCRTGRIPRTVEYRAGAELLAS